jgi:LDH2 family malate/lactate/ureidoglycolate dehydrogenase
MLMETRIAADRLERWSADLLVAAGVPAEDAAEVARHLVFADLRGVDTHGTSRLKIYLTRLETGAMHRTTHSVVMRESPVHAVIDGGNGFGQVIARDATDAVIEKASAIGMASATVYHSNHCGCLAYYTLRMAERGLIGFACTNAPAFMPPFGAKQAFFGTNPFSVAAPAGHNPPFVLDMATSQVARGKIINAAREGTSIPEGWAIDREGRPTTDAAAAMAGLVLPMGGAKGSGLAAMVELFAGVLSGSLLSPDLPRMYEHLDDPAQLGHFFMAIKPDLFLSRDEFGARMDAMLDGIRATPPAPGFDAVLAPGDLERYKEAEHRRLGVPITSGVLGEFTELAARYGVLLPE